MPAKICPFPIWNKWDIPAIRNSIEQNQFVLKNIIRNLAENYSNITKLYGKYLMRLGILAMQNKTINHLSWKDYVTQQDWMSDLPNVS